MELSKNWENIINKSTKRFHNPNQDRVKLRVKEYKKNEKRKKKYPPSSPKPQRSEKHQAIAAVAEVD